MRRVSIEQSLQQYGLYTGTFGGNSMLPFIRPNVDQIIVVPVSAERPLRLMDVVLYRSAQGVLTFHRIIGETPTHYMISGDNATYIEQIAKDDIIGVMTHVMRQGEEVNLQHWRYALYQVLWCRPWRMRVFLLKVRNKLSFRSRT